MEQIFARTSEILEPFRSQEHRGNIPSPAFTLQVSNTIQPGSNLFAVQKTFSGDFQFDIFYESASANHKLDGTAFPFVLSLTLMSTTQPRPWIRGSQLLPQPSLLISSRSSPSHPVTTQQRSSPKLLPRICWVESVISTVLQSRIVGLPTSGTKKTVKRTRSQGDPSSRNPGNCLLRPQAEVSFQEDSIGMRVEFGRSSGTHRTQGRRFSSTTHRSLGQCLQLGNPQGLGQPHRRRRLGGT